MVILNQVQKDGQKQAKGGFHPTRKRVGFTPQFITVLLQILFVKADCPYKEEENNMSE